MFVDAALAARIDTAEARLSAAVARTVEHSVTIAIGEGAAVIGRPGSPVNKIIGAGFEGPLDDSALDRAELAFARAEETARIELSTLVSPDTLPPLAKRGYWLVGAENVLVRVPTAPPAANPAIRVRTGDDAAWQRILVDGFAAPDGTGAVVDTYTRELIEQTMDDFARAEGFTRYVAYLDGQAAGAATMRIDAGVALLCGATTLAPARRRGVQAALLAARLADAHRLGCDVVVVTTAPGSQSQANVMRAGFSLGYARSILVRAVSAQLQSVAGSNA